MSKKKKGLSRFDQMRLASASVPAEYRRNSDGLAGYNYLADCMDCRSVDKFFTPGYRFSAKSGLSVESAKLRVSRNTPVVVPAPKRNRAPAMTLDAVRTIIQSGGHIVDDGLHRQVVFGGRVHGHITNGVLTALRNSGQISAKQIPGSFKIEWTKAV